MGYPVPLTPEDWARVRYEYESTNRKVVDICAEHGISAGTLRDRVRRWGWTPRWSGPLPREGPPPIVVSIVKVQAPEGSHADLAPPKRSDCASTAETGNSFGFAKARALAEAKEEKGDPPDDADELRESLKRQIDAIIEEEREARPRRYLAAWEEFAAEAANLRRNGADPSARDRPLHKRGPL